MPWQRNLSDALAIQKRTGKPLLVCVNMNAEIACERIAAGRYRDPRFVALVRKYIPILASPDRHTDSDYDEHGHRIPCPKFGRITCGEHMAIEPELYEKYFSGRRVAPRHVGIDAKGNQLFDLFLLPRLGVIDETIENHGKHITVKNVDYDSMTIAACLKLPDHEARRRVEKAYTDGGTQTRKKLTASAAGATVENPEILRLALKDTSAGIRQAALEALTRTSSADLLPLFVPAIAMCEKTNQRTRLLKALARIAKNAPESAAAQKHKCLSGVYIASRVIDKKAWLKSLAENQGDPGVVTADDDLDALDAKLEQLERQLKESPQDVTTLLAIAEANLHYGRVRALQGSDPTFLFEDVRGAGKRILKIDPKSGLAHAYVAQVAYLLSEENTAELSARAVSLLAPDSKAGIASAVLATFAKTRTQQLYDALGSGDKSWPQSWISDIHDTYTVLAHHAAATADHVAAHCTLLAYLEAYGEEKRVIDAGLSHFPGASTVHECLRTRLLREGGPKLLETVYVGLLRAWPDAASMRWFAGYAGIVAAEQWVGQKQNPDAIHAYTVSIEHFARCIAMEPSFRSSSVHFVCLALAGRGRLYLQAKQFDKATADLSAAVRKSPGSVDWKDGLGNTPRLTARLLRRKLRNADRDTLADDLEQVWEEQDIDLNAPN